jgi:hypothetical protein
MPRFSFVAALALAASLLQPAFANDKDDARLAAYRLDKATLVKMEAALSNMADAVKKQPALAKAGKDDDDESIAAVAAFYNSKPPLKKAIESAGLTADSFTLALMAWVQASMAHGMAQSLPADKRAKALADTGVPPANLAFVEANRDYLSKVGAKLKAVQGN